MSLTLQQGDLYTIPPGGTEVIQFPFTLGVGVTVTTKTATPTLLRGSASDPALTVGTLTESAGTVTVPVTSVTAGQLWEIKVAIVTSETPAQTFVSVARVLCEERL
jgi:hypothetical protein